MKGIIFDLDGTLLYTLDSIKKATDKTLIRYGCEPQPLEKYKRFVGDGVTELLERAFRRAGNPDYPREEALEFFRKCFKTDCVYKVTPYSGITELIFELKSKGFKIGCLTNKPHSNAVSVINKYFERDLFDTVFGQKDGIPRKPAPDGALEICYAWNLLPDEIVYIGDSGVDAELGKNAGFYFIGALWGYRDADELISHGADVLAEQPADISKIINRL